MHLRPVRGLHVELQVSLARGDFASKSQAQGVGQRPGMLAAQFPECTPDGSQSNTTTGPKIQNLYGLQVTYIHVYMRICRHIHIHRNK